MTQNPSPILPNHLTPEQKVEVLKLLRAREEASKDTVLKEMLFSIVQRCFLFSRAKIRILCGANQSGKSTVGGADLCIRSGQGIPDSIADEFPQDLIKSGEYWAVAVDFPSSHDVQQKKIFDLLPKRNISTFSKEFREITTGNESKIGFKSADSGREKFQGAVKRGVWGDEELKEDVWDECYMRTITLAGFMSFTFSPLKGLTYAYSKIWKKAVRFVFTKNKHGIEEEVGNVHTLEEIEKLMDRELVIMANTASDIDPNIEAFQMSIYDNPHLSAQEIQNAERKYKDDPAAYNARILGRFTKLTGNNVFDAKSLIKYQAKCPTTFERGEIINGQFRASLDGRLVIFKKKKEVGNGYYIVAGDSSLGTEEGNRAVAQVIDHLTCEQVAVWRGKTDPVSFGSILVDIGKYFNLAYLAPESNNHGIAVINKVRDLKYPKLFCDYEASQQVLKTEPSNVVKKFGWETNLKTKPIMIQDLAEFISTGHLKINDIVTLDELTTYVYHDDGKTGALGGCMDDHVMALAIALQVFQRRSPIRKAVRNLGPSQVDPITGY